MSMPDFSLFFSSQLFQLTFKLNNLSSYLFQFQILRSGENRSYSMSIVPEAGEIHAPKSFKSLRNSSLKPCHLHFPQEPSVLSTITLLIHIKSNSIQCESTLIHREFTPLNIGKPEMSDITRNELQKLSREKPLFFTITRETFHSSLQTPAAVDTLPVVRHLLSISCHIQTLPGVFSVSCSRISSGLTSTLALLQLSSASVASFYLMSL